MNITFNEIYDSKIPGVFCEIDNSMASAGLPGKVAVGLLIGQKLEGSLEPGQVSELISQADQVIPLVGNGSELHRMTVAWKAKNKANKLYVIAVPQIDGVAAEYNLAVTAENAKPGMLNLMIAAREINLTINEDDTAEDIAAALILKINANAMLPVKATPVADKLSEIKLAAKHKGENGNFIDIRLNYFAGQKTAAGVGLIITKTKEGIGNSSIAEVIAALGDGYFTDIVTSYTDAANLKLLRTELKRRFNAMVNRESVAYFVTKGTLNTMLTSVNGLNHQCFSPLMDYKSPNMPEERAARYGAIAAIEFQKDPNRQIATLVLDGDLPAAEELTAEERNMLLNAGISTTLTNVNGETAIEREVTAYRTNDQGATDGSYFDLPTTKATIYMRWSWVERMCRKFNRYKLADDGFKVEPGQLIVTPSILAAETIAWAEDLKNAGIVEDIASFAQSIQSLRDNSDPERVNMLFQPNLINNLRIIAGKLQFIL